jgi:hypothetical protein
VYQVNVVTRFSVRPAAGRELRTAGNLEHVCTEMCATDVNYLIPRHTQGKFTRPRNESATRGYSRRSCTRMKCTGITDARQFEAAAVELQG